MKKIFRFMAVLATVAAALASCAKAEMDTPANEDAAGENVYQGPTKLLTFEAQTGTPQTRTSLGDLVTDGDGKKTQSVLWEEGDEIKILYVVEGKEYSVNATPTSVNGSTAVFEAKVPETGVDTYYAVYPSVIESSIQSGETSELKVTIRTGDTDDPYQYGGFKNANIMVAKCQADAPQLNFKHACSIVRFKTGDKAPGQIYFYSGNRKANRGHAFINFEESGAIASISTESAADKYVYVNANKPDAEYYMPLWSDHTLEDGFIVAFRSSSFTGTEDGDGWRVAYYTQDITLGRGEILDLGVIQNKIRTDYFVAQKAIGKKDGSSWDNACDIAYVRNMFAKPADEDYAYAQQMKLENTNFWFAGDATFVFGTDEAPRLDMCFAAARKGNRCPINFYGGCIGTTGTDKSRDPENQPTVFSGNKNYAIFSVRNKTTLTLDGITLSDARAVAANTYDGLYGAALYVGFISTAKDIYQYGLTFADYAPQVHVNNCIFKGNIEGDAELNGTNGAGSAINLKAGQVYVNKSHFDGNKSYNRGCIHASASATAGSLMYFNCCSFTGNSINTNYGSVIRSLDIDTKVGLNGCSFIDNSCNGAANSQVNILSPSVLTNNTIIEDASQFKNTDNVGIFRMSLSSGGSQTVLANNIILDSSDTKAAVYFGGKYAHTLNSQTNLLGVYNEANETYHTLKDLTDNSNGMTSSKTGMKMSEFGSLTATSGNRYYTWDGNVTDFTYATAAQMVTATRSNTLIGNDFYNWLVEIGAIVDGQFTDCRGYLRATDKMCPGAYDPFATAQNK